MDNHSHIFGRNVLILTVGPIIAAAISLLAEPFIARFYAPAVFGPGMVFATVILTLSRVMFFRYNFAIVQAPDKNTAVNLFMLSLVIFIALLILFSFLLYFFPGISIWLINFDFSIYIFYFILALFFTSISFLMKYWYTYSKMFYMLTINTLIMQVGAVIFLVLLGSLGYRDTESYIFARTVSFVIGPAVFLWYFFRNDLNSVILLFNWKEMVRMMKLFKNYPIFEYWGFLASIVVLQIPLFMVSKYWGDENTGLYAKAYAILSVFTITIGDSVNRVFHREIAGRIQENEPYEDFTIQMIKVLIKATLLPFILISLIGGELFRVLLGAPWEEAGIIGGIIVPWFFFFIISFSIRPLYNLFNRQKIYTLITFLFFVTWMAVFVACYYFGLGFRWTLIVFSSFAALTTLAEIIFLLKLIRLKYGEVLAYMGKKLIGISPFILLKIALVLAKIDDTATVLISFGVLTMIYLYIYYVRDPFIFSFIKNTFIRK